jgi:hypothetical protein
MSLKHAQHWKQIDIDWQRKKFLGIIPEGGVMSMIRRKSKRNMLKLNFEASDSESLKGRGTTRKSYSKRDVVRKPSINISKFNKKRSSKSPGMIVRSITTTPERSGTSTPLDERMSANYFS